MLSVEESKAGQKGSPVPNSSISENFFNKSVGLVGRMSCLLREQMWVAAPFLTGDNLWRIDFLVPLGF